MRHHIAIEDIEPNHYIAWVLDLPGCFSSASTADAAIAGVPKQVNAYFLWLYTHDPALPVIPSQVEVEVVETFQSFPSPDDPGYLVNAFFDDDRRPLSYWDVAIVTRLLQWSYQDMQQLIQSIPPHYLHQPIAGEKRKSIAGILEHIARAENWYLDQLDLALAWESSPPAALTKLATMREHTYAQFVNLIDNERITENSGERWSARKIVRRTLWHERDHLQQIAHLTAQLI